MKRGRHAEANHIWYFLADGDPTLGRGKIAEALGFCYEARGMASAAAYWFGEAIRTGQRRVPYSLARRTTLEAQGHPFVQFTDINDEYRWLDDRMEKGEYRRAAARFYALMDGDPSLEAGCNAEKLAACYDAMGEVQPARYWYRRAVEENPETHQHARARRQILEAHNVDHLVNPAASGSTSRS